MKPVMKFLLMKKNRDGEKVKKTRQDEYDNSKLQ